MFFEDFSDPKMSISQDDHGFEFEFCRVLEPGALPDAPADHLFSNGRLVPHDFACSPTKFFNSLSRSVSQRSNSFGSNSGSSFNSPSRSVSQRSSSFGSNSGFELFSSSGSNSCSSSQRSSSSISSGTTGTSDATPGSTQLISSVRAECTPKPYKARKHVSAPGYGSRKWQFIAPAPVLNRNVLQHRSGKVSQIKKPEIAETQTVLKAKQEGKSNGRWRRFFCLFVSTCSKFHAIEPSTAEY